MPPLRHRPGRARLGSGMEPQRCWPSADPLTVDAALRGETHKRDAASCELQATSQPPLVTGAHRGQWRVCRVLGRGWGAEDPINGFAVRAPSTSACAGTTGSPRQWQTTTTTGSAAAVETHDHGGLDRALCERHAVSLAGACSIGDGGAYALMPRLIPPLVQHATAP